MERRDPAGREPRGKSGPPAPPPRILGIDPGTRRLGYAVLEAGPRPRVRDIGALPLRASDPIPERLGRIFAALRALIVRHRPAVVALEKIFHGKNFQSAMKVGEARGVALLAGALARIPVVEYTPAVVKKAATGNGRADKRQVQRMISRLLGLKYPPEPLDASDALAIAFCHARRLGRPELGKNPRPGESPLQAFLDSVKRQARSGPGSARGATRTGRHGTPGGIRALLARAAARAGEKRRIRRIEMQEKRTPRKPGGSSPAVMIQSEIPGAKLVRRGKVRDIYDLGEHMLLVATDRLSAFDVVLPDGIPDKGKVLTRLSVFWFELLGFPNHLVTADARRLPQGLQPHAEALRDRFMLVKRLDILPIECVVRGYLSGSGWPEYKERGSICGVSLPRGLVESDRLPEPIFTPTTKAEAGHDLPLTYDEVAERVGKERAAELRDKTIAVYKKAAGFALQKGIIIADTKFEWGIPPGGPARDPGAAPAVLADEVLTPDSSRFWPQSLYKPGKGQPSFDKQYVRDYLLTLQWDKTPPGPKLPEEVIDRTAAKYREIYELLTGRKWS